MSDALWAARMRRFLLWLACAMFAGVALELVLTGHYAEPLQWVPLIACAAGMVLTSAAALAPNRGLLLTLRALMAVTAISGVLGAAVHINGNLAFAREVNAAKANAAPLRAALSGANPPLAPGALGVTALLAVAATTWHPALQRATVAPVTNDRLRA
jgi:hypothetical protein